MAKTKIGGVILAGGQSRRMGGGDKALLDLAGRPMLAHVIEGLKLQAAPLAISANGDPARFRFTGLPVLPDTVPGFVGPLAGVLAGLRWARALGEASHIVTVPADAPFIPPDLVRRLHEASLMSPAGLAVASSNGRSHPVVALWPMGLAEALEAALRRGEKKVQAFVESARAVRVDFQAVSLGERTIDPFFNANTPEDLCVAREIARERRAP